MEISPVPGSISDQNLEEEVCKTLPLTGIKVEVHFEESLYLSDSMCTENHNLFYKCRQLKHAKRIHACWFFNNVINVRLMDKGPIFKIFLESDLGELLGANVDDLLRNSSA